jgi:hypothetical protein
MHHRTTLLDVLAAMVGSSDSVLLSTRELDSFGLGLAERVGATHAV